MGGLRVKTTLIGTVGGLEAMKVVVLTVVGSSGLCTSIYKSTHVSSCSMKLEVSTTMKHSTRMQLK